MVFAPHWQIIEYAASKGFYSHAVEFANRNLGEGYAGRAVLERRTVHVTNLMEMEGSLAQALKNANEDFVDYYGVPQIVKGDVKGVLEIYHRVPLEFYSEQLGFLETLGGQAALAIEYA